MRIFRCFPILFLLSICAFAQTRATSALIGHVEDPAHARVAGAELVLQNSETGLTRKATTDSSGTYSFGNLPLTGLYSVEATKTGFARAKKQGIQLQAGDTTVLNFGLNVAEEKNIVTVSGTPDSVN